ncbi:MAG: ABC transporter substrate-binding protein [Anaerolineales bacterium]|nr:ABC transporter substrate-binding protein [Anaerolineales bacterium]
MPSEKPTATIAFAISTRPQRPAEENPIYRGAQIAIDELKQDASLPVRLEWKVFDDFGNTETTEKFAREIVADPGIIGVVGPMGSSEAFASASIYHEAGLVQVSPCASHPDLCQRGYETFFRLVANENGQGGELARMAYGYRQGRRAAIIHAMMPGPPRLLTFSLVSMRNWAARLPGGKSIPTETTILATSSGLP